MPFLVITFIISVTTALFSFCIIFRFLSAIFPSFRN